MSGVTVGSCSLAQLPRTISVVAYRCFGLILMLGPG